MFEQLIIDLLPKGRAFLVPFFSTFKKVIVACSFEFERVKERADLIQYDAYPQTTTLIGEHEQLMGLSYHSSLSKKERVDRVIARRSAVGGQSDAYFKDVLSKFGFIIGTTYNENRLNPANVLPSFIGKTLGGGAAFGGLNARFGGASTSLIVNGISNDAISEDQNTWTFYFFIHSSESINTPLKIPNARKNEFVELILRYKPAHTIAILYAEFV
jgi:uncharacterized protein YmfQ (DUF2313 family)